MNKIPTFTEQLWRDTFLSTLGMGSAVSVAISAANKAVEAFEKKFNASNG